MTTTENPQCPDYSSHYDNVAELLFPGTSVLSTAQDDIVGPAAEVEYRCCEGH
jgi:hypothetical protein